MCRSKTINHRQWTCAQINEKTSQTMDKCSDQSKNIIGNGMCSDIRKRNITDNKTCAQNEIMKEQSQASAQIRFTSLAMDTWSNCHKVQITPLARLI
jgi:hypothetical protein